MTPFLSPSSRVGPAVGALWLAGALLLAGCKTTDGSKPSKPAPLGASDITELHLLAAASAISLDDQGHVAGFPVRVYASSPASPETVPIVKGTLDILMFDGTVTPATVAASQPLRAWSFTADQLRARARVTTVGTSYLLTLLWGEQRPTEDRITVVGRYNHPQGVKLYSALATVFVQNR
jgi:hypothetical protein